MNEEVDRSIRMRMGTRVRVYYLTRVVYHAREHAPGLEPLTVWGGNSAGETTHTAHTIARLVARTATHLILQPDRMPRRVAIPLDSIQNIAGVILAPR